MGHLERKAEQELEYKSAAAKDNNGTCDKIRFTREELDEMVQKSETLRSLTGILHTDMTLDEIRKARLAKHL
jgi:hypothetical protein